MEYQDLVKKVGLGLAICSAPSLPDTFWRTMGLTECLAVLRCGYASPHHVRKVLIRLREVEANFSQLLSFYLNGSPDSDTKETIQERLLSLPLTLEECQQICTRLPKSDELGKQAFCLLKKLAQQ